LQAPFPSQALGETQAPAGTLSCCPLAMFEQAPGDEPLHVWQVGQLADPQQTPSTQAPLKH
jgi:hypothetical protein